MFRVSRNLFDIYRTIISLELKAYTEKELVEALKQRRNAAYRHLYLHYRGALYNNILQVLPNAEAAADVLQDVFVQIWKNIDKYDDSKGRLFTWMLKLTRNMAINQTRVKNFKVHSQNEDISNYVSSIDQKAGGHTGINHIGLRQQVHKLRPEYKDVIELSYFQGFKQEEIAAALKIPLGTVKTRLRNAIIELRRELI
ncbi:MAG: RNA polymerase sigma factor [Bacteroidota bacterium]